MSVRPRRLGAIRIGEDTIRALFVEAEARDSYRTLASECAATGLAQGFARRGDLAAAALGRTVEALERMRPLALGLRAEWTRVVAASPLRDAPNIDALLGRAREALGAEVDVATPEEEARWAWLSAVEAFGEPQDPTVVLDVGGSDLLLAIGSSQAPSEIHRLPLGARRLAERFLLEDPPGTFASRNVRRHARALLSERIADAVAAPPAPDAPPSRVVASGPAVESVARAALGPLALHGAALRRKAAARALRRLRGMTVEEQGLETGIGARAAETLVPGAALLVECLRALGAPRLVVNGRGLPGGIVAEMLDRAFPARGAETARGGDGRYAWLGGVLSFADSFRFEKDHALHVAFLAGEAFDALAALHGLGPRDREILEAAAILHDVSEPPDPRDHERRGYEGILGARFPGLTARERRLVALVVLYHRGEPPGRSDPEIGSLAREDRRRVRRLAAILRLADGLDRGHARRVLGLGARVAPSRVELLVECAELPDHEIWGARRKADLFRSLFGREVAIHPIAAAPGGTPRAIDAGPG